MLITPAGLFVDTSGWADSVLRNTPDHAAMEAFFKQTVADRRTLITTNYVVAELVALLTTRSRASRPQILALVNSLKRMPNLRIIHIDPALDDEAWSLLERQPDKDWSLVDAASFVVMRHLSIAQAFTTDQHFVQAGFVRLPERQSGRTARTASANTSLRACAGRYVHPCTRFKEVYAEHRQYVPGASLAPAR